MSVHNIAFLYTTTNQPAIIPFVLTLNLVDVVAPCIAPQLEQTNYACICYNTFRIVEKPERSFFIVSANPKDEKIDAGSIVAIRRIGCNKHGATLLN